LFQLLPLLTSAVSSDIDTYMRRKRRNLLGYCVATLFALTAYFACIMAFITWLMRSNDPTMSWIIVGVIFISLALTALIFLLALSRYEKYQKKNTASATSTAALMFASQASKSSSTLTAILALAGAYFAYSQSGKSSEDS